MPDQIALQAALLPRFARLRNITPLVSICSEGSSADSAAPRTWCDLVVVRRQGMQDDAQIAQAVGRWWRRQLGIQFAVAMRADMPLAVRAVRAIFESDVVPCDTGALARSVGCSREHLARELERSLRGGFHRKSAARFSDHDGVVCAAGRWAELAGGCAGFSREQAHIATHNAKSKRRVARRSSRFSAVDRGGASTAVLNP